MSHWKTVFLDCDGILQSQGQKTLHGMSEETSRQRSRKCVYHLAASGYSAYIAEIASIEPRKSCGLYGQQGELERKAVGRSSESEKNKAFVEIQTESKKVRQTE